MAKSAPSPAKPLRRGGGPLQRLEQRQDRLLGKRRQDSPSRRPGHRLPRLQRPTRARLSHPPPGHLPQRQSDQAMGIDRFRLRRRALQPRFSELGGEKTMTARNITSAPPGAFWPSSVARFASSLRFPP